MASVLRTAGQEVSPTTWGGGHHPTGTDAWPSEVLICSMAHGRMGIHLMCCRLLTSDPSASLESTGTTQGLRDKCPVLAQIGPSHGTGCEMAWPMQRRTQHMKQSVCLVPFWGMHQKLISALGMANFLQRDMAPSSAAESKAIPGEQTRIFNSRPQRESML